MNVDLPVWSSFSSIQVARLAIGFPFERNLIALQWVLILGFAKALTMLLNCVFKN